jgi:hypothetical protein
MYSVTVMPLKIAFLFLTMDDPNFPDVWNHYFLNNEDKINIYIHPKYPENVRWNQDRIISDLKETAWGYIVNAYKSLFIEAIKDKDNFVFVTISESCLPIKPFLEFYNYMVKNNGVSLIKILPIKKYDLSERITPEIIKSIGMSRLIKHYARMCLSRAHVKQLLSTRTKLNLFIKMHVGDEFFLSSIAPLDNYKNCAVTFDDWEYVEKQKKLIKQKIAKLYDQQESDTNINNLSKINKCRELFNDIAKNPKTIMKVSKEDWANITSTNSFFYRKFDRKSDIETYIYPLLNAT